MGISKSRLVIIGLISLFAISCTPRSKNSIENTSIKIGEFLSLSGPQASFGKSTHKGIRLAFKIANENGGIQGRTLELVTRDDEGRASRVKEVVTDLIEKEKVLALIGQVASHLSLTAAPLAQQAKTPMISPGSTNPEVTEIGSHIFRVCFIDPFQGFVMAKFAHNKLKIRKVAVLRDVNSEYSKGLADHFLKTFVQLGGEIVADQNYSSGDMDFEEQLRVIRASKPEGLFIPGYYTEVALIAKQAQRMGIKTRLLGGDGWDSQKLFEIGREAVNGGYFSNHFNPELDSDEVKSFTELFVDEYKHAPDGMAAMGFDAAQLLIEAIRNADPLSKENIRRNLATTKNFPGVTGKITINENRNAKKPAVVVKVDGPNNRFVTTINP